VEGARGGWGGGGGGAVVAKRETADAGRGPSEGTGGIVHWDTSR